MIIYKITNNVNGKFYIGKTVKSAEERFKKHSHNHKKQNTHLYKSMRKHGVENFSIEVVEEVKQNINERECYWIEKLNPHYNMTSGGDGGDTSSSPNYIAGMKNRVHPHNPSFGMLGKKHPGKGKSLVANRCPVVCEGVQYNSVGDAEAAYPGIKVRNRLDNPNYPEFYRLRQKTLRR